MKQVTKSESEQASSLYSVLKDFFSGGSSVQKGAMADNYSARIKSNNFWTAFSSLQDTLQHYNWSSDRYEFETDAGKVQEALAEFNQIITEMLTAENVIKAMGRPSESTVAVLKAGKKISAKNMKEIKEAHAALGRLIDLKNEADSDDDDESVEKAHMKKFAGVLESGITKAIEPLNDRVSALMKANTTTIATGSGVQEFDMSAIEKTLTAALCKQLDPIEKRIDAIEKARGVSRQQELTTDPVTKSNKSYMTYFE